MLTISAVVMALSDGNNLPIVDTPRDRPFLAGDGRAQENPDLVMRPSAVRRLAAMAGPIRISAIRPSNP
jgi:hypothetical protein